jgi:integrase
MAKKAKKSKQVKKEKKTHPSRRSGKPLSEKQFKKLMCYVRESATTARLHGASRAIIDELIVDLLVEAGLKPKELCDLCLRDTPGHQAANTVTVRSKQGHRARDIPISQPMAERLKRFSTLYRQGAKPKDPLILSERGNPLGYFSIYSKIHRIGLGAGIKNLQPNTLRKTYIANLFAKEQDLRLVQQQAGHSSPKTTALYIQQVNPAPKAEKAKSKVKAKIKAKAKPRPKPKSPARKKCEACGKRVSTNRIAQIDSGQVLCITCLNELRG